jgi:hypothetical protein
MASLEKYLEALIGLKAKTAEDSLKPSETQKTEYHFGFVCGVQVGLKLAEELLNSQLEDENDDGNDKRSTQARRRG